MVDDTNKPSDNASAHMGAGLDELLRLVPGALDKLGIGADANERISGAVAKLQEFMAQNPEAAERLGATIRQATDSWSQGHHASFADAIAAFTGRRPESAQPAAPPDDERPDDETNDGDDDQT